MHIATKHGISEIRSSIKKSTRYTVLLVAGLLIGAVILTTSTSWASGESIRSEATAVAEESYSYPQQFDAKLGTSLATLASKPDNAVVSSAFYASYVDASQTYGLSLLSAAQVYSETYVSDPAGSKNTYVDAFNRAGDTYFNQLEGARNRVVSELSGKDDIAKDMFVNEYNSARDTYRSQLDVIKKDLSEL